MAKVLTCGLETIIAQNRRWVSIHFVRGPRPEITSMVRKNAYDSWIRRQALHQSAASLPSCSFLNSTQRFPVVHVGTSYSLQSSYYISNGLGWTQVHYIHTSPGTGASNSDEPSSKVEETVKNVKQQLVEKEKGLVAAPKRSIWKRIEDEILHYYHGFRLLWLDTRICVGLVWRILNGKALTRREHRQLIRTSSDLFRLVPFSVFIIVPFMELLLPFFLKFFPGMLPSTFQTKLEREDKMKAQLKVKLEMAKFLQKTLDEMALESKGHSSDKAKEFSIFFTKIRKSGEEVSNKDIIEFSKLFEDEITLDSLSRQQLQAICRVLEIPPIGTNTLLRYQLRWRLNQLKKDDKTIEVEGVESLNVAELQSACKARGMRAVGVREDRLRRQLEQWLQLSLHEKVPPSLLLLSRALYLPDHLPATAQLQATLQALPDAAAIHTKAAIGELEGKVDHKTRLEIVKEEQRMIREEREEAKEQIAPQKVKPKKEKEDKVPVPEQPQVEELPTAEKVHVPPKPVGTAPVDSGVPLSTELHLSPDKYEPVTVSEVVEYRLSRYIEHPMAELDKGTLTDESELEKLDPENMERDEKAEIQDLKSELADYEEDIKDLNVLKHGDTTLQLKESKGAKRLYKHVNKMISSLDGLVNKLPPDTPAAEAKEIPPKSDSPQNQNPPDAKP